METPRVALVVSDWVYKVCRHWRLSDQTKHKTYQQILFGEIRGQGGGQVDTGKKLSSGPKDKDVFEEESQTNPAPEKKRKGILTGIWRAAAKAHIPLDLHKHQINSQEGAWDSCLGDLLKFLESPWQTIKCNWLHQPTTSSPCPDPKACQSSHPSPALICTQDEPTACLQIFATLPRSSQESPKQCPCSRTEQLSHSRFSSSMGTCHMLSGVILCYGGEVLFLQSAQCGGIFQ
ncbi:hypothetical protein Bbelb_414170, partial [Branchiostoma belcheri]